MSETLVLFLPSASDEPWQWLRIVDAAIADRGLGS
jgi:hypothetical protein